MTVDTYPVPAIGDAVVIRGNKFRIREIEDPLAFLAPAGPSWRRCQIVGTANVVSLHWDRVAAVWRQGIA